VSEDRVPVSEILDDASGLLSHVAAPWIGVLWLTALPVRFAQAHFAARLLEFRAEAAHYGDYLRDLALLSGAAFLVSLWGRAVFVRACTLAFRSDAAPGRAALRVPWPSLLAYAYVALLVETLFLALAPTLVAIPIFVTLAGLAAAAHPDYQEAGLLMPLRLLARQLAQGRALVGLVFVFGTALLVALVNLFALYGLGIWLVAAVPGLDPTAWQVLLSLENRRFVLALLVGAMLAVEPFWLASLSVFVMKSRSRETGEDLRLWFERLRTGAGTRA
jgi:hypothetical protein